jgi:circadian clock protein KaiB
VSSGVAKRVEAVAGELDDHYVLRLFVAGASPASQSAIVNLERVCADALHGRYTLEVIDVRQHPVRAADEQIFATPTVVKLLPPPTTRLIGDLSDREHVLLGLDLRPNAG